MVELFGPIDFLHRAAQVGKQLSFLTRVYGDRNLTTFVSSTYNINNGLYATGQLTEIAIGYYRNDGHQFQPTLLYTAISSKKHPNRSFSPDKRFFPIGIAE